MKLPSFLFGLSLVTGSVLAHPLDLPFKLTQHEINTLERRQGGHVITRGASGSANRLEIRTMQKTQPDQFTLLLLTMQKFQATSQSSGTSYFQISGIHGVPKQDWGGVKQCSSCNKADGYCTHDSILFPAWHRAYMALFEQEFIGVAKSVANSFPSSSKARMVAAANTIRVPYWDWAANIAGNNLPDAVSSPTISVNGPNGQQSIANPLYSHHFTDPKSLGYGPFSTWQNTLRYPTSVSPTATSNESGAIGALNRIRGSLRDQLYKLLTGCTDYQPFSNDNAGGRNSACGNSLEGLHNTIHTTTGGVPSASVPAGHMYYLSTAAFDPVFWFHHAQVDRIFALWQGLHTSYGGSQQETHGSWTVPPGSTSDENTPLEPFFRSGNSFWTTTTVKDWKTFGYNYPEYSNSDGSSASIAKAVNALYGRGGGSSAKRGIFDIPQGGLADDGSAFEYVANIEAPRYALDGTFQIYLFLGDPSSEDPTSWINDDNLVGPMGVLSQSGMSNKEVTISGSVPLTRTLTDKLGAGVLSKLSEDEVVPYLEKSLNWRVMGPIGEAVDPENIPRFKISVFSTTSTNPDAEEFLPKYSEYKAIPAATQGKRGGALGLEDLEG